LGLKNLKGTREPEKLEGTKTIWRELEKSEKPERNWINLKDLKRTDTFGIPEENWKNLKNYKGTKRI
jgi:hypothetical protein